MFSNIQHKKGILHSSIEENIAEKLSGKRYTTSKQIPFEELKTYINSFIKDKANSAKNEIEKTSLADADKEKEKEKINNYVATAATTINSAININVVINAQNTAISAIDKVLSEVKLADAKIVRTWSGWVDMMVDGVPVLGFVDEVPGLVLAAGFCGHGFGIAPGAAYNIAELITTGTSPVDMTALRYDRFKAKI